MPKKDDRRSRSKGSDLSESDDSSPDRKRDHKKKRSHRHRSSKRRDKRSRSRDRRDRDRDRERQKNSTNDRRDGGNRGKRRDDGHFRFDSPPKDHELTKGIMAAAASIGGGTIANA